MHFTEDEKHHLRIAARLLRLRGHRFQQGNFYDLVHTTVKQLELAERKELFGLSEWISEYERYEQQGCAPAQPRKQKNS